MLMVTSERADEMRMTRAVAVAVTLTLAFVPAAVGQAQPRYDVPQGYARCPQVTAWNGFFKWMSVKHATCRHAQRFLRTYARTAERGPMPRHVRGFRCTIRYWRTEEGDIYASRHRCTRGPVAIRFYGMV
jgi:hypothetical protein